MKKIIFTITLLCTYLAVFAQPSERMQAFKAAYFTEELELTTEESRAFWPIYDEYETERERLRRAARPNKRIKDLTDAELEMQINLRFEMEEKELALKRTYFQKFKMALPIRKVANIHHVERKFKKEVLGMIRERRAERRRSDGKR